MTDAPRPMPSVPRRDVVPHELAEDLRSMLYLPPGAVLHGELAVTMRRIFPTIVCGVDAEGWLAWALAGLLVHANGAPTFRRARAESRRAILALAMLRARANISAAADFVGLSRKVFRDNLRALDLYPWPGTERSENLSQTIGARALADDSESWASRLINPYRRLVVSGPAPMVVEDGSKGTVWFVIENEETRDGLANLQRGDRIEPLFRGLSVHHDVALAYAREYGHGFLLQDVTP